MVGSFKNAGGVKVELAGNVVAFSLEEVIIEPLCESGKE